MNNDVLEDIKQYALKRLMAAYDSVSSAQNGELADISAYDENGNELNVRITIKPDEDQKQVIPEPGIKKPLSDAEGREMIDSAMSVGAVLDRNYLRQSYTFSESSSNIEGTGNTEVEAASDFMANFCDAGSGGAA